jgi:Uncharacterized protein conserved in bacteria
MKIELTEEASKWFKDEVGVKPGDGIHFYGKVYGKTMVHEGSLLHLEQKNQLIQNQVQKLMV